MKKIISIALVLMMLTTLCFGAFAESVGGFTPQDVFTWLNENDEKLDTAKMQAVNGSHRLAEMLVCMASPNANEQNTEDLEFVLDEMTKARQDSSMSEVQLMSVGAVSILRVLRVLCMEIDSQGANQEGLDQLLQAYAAGDDAAEDANGQTVNALNFSFRLAALMAIEICSTPDEAAQIQAGLDEAAAFEPTDNPWDAMANGSKWLYKFLGAFVKLQDSSKIDQIEALTASTEELVAKVEAPEQEVANWLYSSVNAVGILLGAVTFND